MSEEVTADPNQIPEEIALFPTINANGAFGEVDLDKNRLSDRIRREQLNAKGEVIGEEFFRLKFYTRQVGNWKAIVAIYVSERFGVMDQKSKVMFRPAQREAVIGQHVNNFSSWLFTYGHRLPMVEKNVPLEEAEKI